MLERAVSDPFLPLLGVRAWVEDRVPLRRGESVGRAGVPVGPPFPAVLEMEVERVPKALGEDETDTLLLSENPGEEDMEGEGEALPEGLPLPVTLKELDPVEHLVTAGFDGVLEVEGEELSDLEREFVGERVRVGELLREAVTDTEVERIGQELVDKVWVLDADRVTDGVTLALLDPLSEEQLDWDWEGEEERVAEGQGDDEEVEVKVTQAVAVDENDTVLVRHKVGEREREEHSVTDTLLLREREGVPLRDAVARAVGVKPLPLPDTHPDLLAIRERVKGVEGDRDPELLQLALELPLGD